MKRFLTALMTVSAIFALSSCKENNPVEELDGPVIEWPANSSFATVDITEDLDASLTVTAEAGIKGLTVEVQSDLLAAALQLLGITDTELDFINDKVLIGAFAMIDPSLPTGDRIFNQTEVDFNISTLVQMINSLTMEDGNHTFVINVTDNNGKTAEATCTFHRVGVSGPSVEWPSNPDFATVDITEDLDATLTVNAPAGIRTFTVSVDSESLAPMLAMLGLSSEMDLINDPIVAAVLGGMGVPTGDQLLDQTSVEFNITSLVALIPELAENGTEHSFSLAITDNNGTEFTQTCTFRVVK